MQVRRKYQWAMLLVLVGLVTGCKVADDAIAASQQMAATATDLSAYYQALDSEVADTIALYELEQATAGIPYGDDDRKLQQQTRLELQKRADLAEALARLSSAFSLLVSSKSAANVETSATQLGDKLNTLNALPGGASVPANLGKAGNLLVQLIQQHDEKRAGRAMDEMLHEVEKLFAAEKHVYDSIARTHAIEANQVARDLIKAKAVDPSPMLGPALKPYGLSPLPPSAALQAELSGLALSRLEVATNEATHKEQEASSAMLDALHDMSERIDLLANERPMLLRGTPLSLKRVEDWVQSWSASLI